MMMVICRVCLFWSHIPGSKHDLLRTRFSALLTVGVCLCPCSPLLFPPPKECPINPWACLYPFKYRVCVLVYIKVILIQYHSLIFILKFSQRAFGQSSVGLIPRFGVVGLAATVNGISFSIAFSSWLLLVQNESWLWQPCWEGEKPVGGRGASYRILSHKLWSLSLHLRSKGSEQGGGGGGLLYLPLITVFHALHYRDPCRSATHAPDLSWAHHSHTDYPAHPQVAHSFL